MVVLSDKTDPYYNLALEKHLFDNFSGGAVFYLWQNDKTVVVGNYQNIYRECNMQKIKTDGIRIARRLTGGGAVYHDLGNLNFSFISENADTDKNYQVIIDALNSFDILAEKTGRNDIFVNGSKFSGNAFLSENGKFLHHGTILINSDLEDVLKYLTPSPLKIKTKAVESSRNRVVNLIEINPKITVENLKKELIKHCGQDEIIKISPPENLISFFSSDAFLIGKNPKTGYEINGKTPYGNVTVVFNVEGNIITDAEVFTDSLYGNIADQIKLAMNGKKFVKSETKNIPHIGGMFDKFF